MHRIPKIPELTTRSDRAIVEEVVLAIGDVASEYRDNLGRAGQWVKGMEEGARYATELTLSSLRQMGLLQADVDQEVFAQKIESSIPK